MTAAKTARPVRATATMSRPSAGRPAAAINPSHNAWSKFFDKHMYVARPPPSRSSADTAAARQQRPRYGAAALAAAAHGGLMSPRRTRSHRDLASEAKDRSGGATATAEAAKSATNTSESEYDDMLNRLRKLVLTEGVPNDDFQLPTSRASARSLVWKLLLDVRSVDAAAYLTLLARGPSIMHDKICNDTFRTLATDQLFKERVDEAALIRMLNAFVWRYSDMDDASTGSSFNFSYVQGMNVLAAPFLYVMPSELEAFHCFCLFIEHFCPTYVQPTLAGVHRGLQLLERCLQMADPALYSHLHSLNLNAELYAFPSVLTMSACTPPLRQVLQVWDYLLAFGVHMSIPCIVAQLLLVRDELIATQQPMKILRQFPDLDAHSIVGIATTLVRDMDDSLYDDLVRHMLEL